MIILGQKYTDKLTGFKGTAVVINENLNGRYSVNLQPSGLNKDGSIKEAVWFDMAQLKGKMIPDPEPTKGLGKPGEDHITEYKGVVVHRMTHLHGCVHLGLQATVKADGSLPVIQLFDEQRVWPESKVSTGFCIVSMPPL